MVALTMLAFGIGTALPLLLLALWSREALMRWRGRMLYTAAQLKMALGMLLIAAGIITLAGIDRLIQTWLLQALPEWLLNITTSI